MDQSHAFETWHDTTTGAEVAAKEEKIVSTESKDGPATSGELTDDATTPDAVLMRGRVSEIKIQKIG